MSTIAKDTGGVDFDPVPAVMQHAVCYAVIDIGIQPQNNPLFKPKAKVVFIWELPYVKIKIKKEWTPGQPPFEKELPRAISETFTLSLSEKSNLLPFLQSWRGKAFTEAQLNGFDVRTVAGANCLLNIIHETKNGKTYANIATAVPLMPTMTKLVPVNPIIKFSLDDYPAEVTIPAAIPDWIKAKIMQSKEYIAKNDTSGQSQEQEHAAAGAVGADAAIGEDVPF